MKQTLKPNAELDILTRAELHAEIVGLASGYLRPPEAARHPGGIELDGSGNSILTGIYRVEAGMRFFLTRVEFALDGYSARAPYNPSVQGGIDLYVDGQWRDGYPFGGSSGGVLPVTYTKARVQSVMALDGALIQAQVLGGPASTGLTIAVCGILEPIEPVF